MYIHSGWRHTHWLFWARKYLSAVCCIYSQQLWARCRTSRLWRWDVGDATLPHCRTNAQRRSTVENIHVDILLWLTFRFRKCFLLLLSLLDFNDNFWSLLPSHQTPFSVHCLHNVNATTTVFPRLRTHSFDHSAHARMTCLFLTCLFLPGDGRSWSSQWSGRPSWHWSESSRKVPACTWVAARTAVGGRGGWALPVLLLPYDSTWGKKWWRISLGLIEGVATLSKSINVVKQRKNDCSLESAAFLITYRNKKQQLW